MYYSRYTSKLQECAVTKVNTFHHQQSTVNSQQLYKSCFCIKNYIVSENLVLKSLILNRKVGTLEKWNKRFLTFYYKCFT